MLIDEWLAWFRCMYDFSMGIISHIFMNCFQVVRLAAEAGAHVKALPLALGSQSLHITPLAAHILSQLLLQGGPLLASCLPPPASALEAMQLSSGGASSPKRGELRALESAVGEVLRLIPLIATSAKSFAHELPIEEFLFFVSALQP